MEFLLNRGKTAIAVMLLVMFVTPMATPFASSEATTSARASPDFSVTSFTLDGAGSVQDGVDVYVETSYQLQSYK